MDGAAGGGHLEVVRWLARHRREGCSQAAFDMAAAAGYLHVIEVRGFGAQARVELLSHAVCGAVYMGGGYFRCCFLAVFVELHLDLISRKACGFVSSGTRSTPTAEHIVLRRPLQTLLLQRLSHPQFTYCAI